MSETELHDELMLDGNAVAGLLQEIFGSEMTANEAECAKCGNLSQMGALLAYTQAPGVVLRCPACNEVMLRVVQTPRGIFVEARGAAHIRLQVTS